MKYRVVVTPRARIQMYNDAIWWAENRDVDQAVDWLECVDVAIASLADTPEQHPVARENDDLPMEIRQINLGIGNKPTHRIVFEVRDEKVIVLGVRHLAQRDLCPEDI